MVKIEKIAEDKYEQYRDLWKEVRKIKDRNMTCTNCVYGHSDDEDMCDISLKHEYEELYNCVPYTRIYIYLRAISYCPTFQRIEGNTEYFSKWSESW